MRDGLMLVYSKMESRFVQLAYRGTRGAVCIRSFGICSRSTKPVWTISTDSKISSYVSCSPPLRRKLTFLSTCPPPRTRDDHFPIPPHQKHTRANQAPFPIPRSLAARRTVVPCYFKIRGQGYPYDSRILSNLTLQSQQQPNVHHVSQKHVNDPKIKFLTLKNSTQP